MPAFGDLSGELVGRLPGLSPFLAQTFINRAWATIRDEREWAFLTTDGQLNCPASVTAGTAAIVLGSVTVNMTAAATTALNAIPNSPGLTALQIRFMGAGTTSQIYNITVAAGNPLVFTLDRPVQEPTNALSAYMVYRVYVRPPIADFQRWISLDDMVNGIRIVKDKLTYSSSYFDAKDPQRQALGLAYFLGFYKGSSAVSAVDSTPIYELWPGSTQGQSWYVRFQRRGLDPAPADPVPSTIPDALIVEGALHAHAYPHCMANIGHFPAMKGVTWATLIATSRKEYRDRLNTAKLADNEIADQMIISRGHGLKSGGLGGPGFPYPIDSNFFQSHPIFW